MNAAPPQPEIDLDTATRLRMAIGLLSRRLRPTAAAVEAGLTPTRVTVLLDVVRRGPLRLADVAAAEGINPTMLSRVVSTLVEGELLERTSDPHDRRAAWVQATAAGRRLAERMRRERTRAVVQALKELEPREREAVLSALPALEAMAQILGEVPR